MKIGDIVICIDNENNENSLTFNKSYKILDIHKTSIYVHPPILIELVDDTKMSYFFKKNRFISVSQKRKIQLKNY